MAISCMARESERPCQQSLSDTQAACLARDSEIVQIELVVTGQRLHRHREGRGLVGTPGVAEQVTQHLALTLGHPAGGGGQLGFVLHHLEGLGFELVITLVLDGHDGGPVWRADGADRDHDAGRVRTQTVAKRGDSIPQRAHKRNRVTCQRLVSEPVPCSRP